MHVATIHCDWGIFATIEVPTAPVQALLPAGLRAHEIRPGFVELRINVVRFPGGGMMGPEPVWEIDFGALLEADNRAFPHGPAAAKASYILNLASTSAAYDAECRRRSYPVHASTGLTFVPREADGTLGVTVSDDAGLIAEFAPLPLPAADGWTTFERAGQDVVQDELGALRINYVFTGQQTALIQRAPGGLRVGEHSFFRGLVAADFVSDVHWLVIRPDVAHALAFHKGDLPQ